MIVLHIYYVVKKKVGKLSYTALITFITCLKGINIIDDFKIERMVNLEICKETLKKMVLRMTLEGWVNK